MDFIFNIFVAVASGVIAGFISWKLLSKKEEQRTKECKAMGNIIYISTSSWIVKASIGFLLFFTPPFFITIIEAKGINEGIFHTIICYGILIWTVGYILFMFYRIPMYAIVDNCIIVWKYYGFARPTKYPMQELTRKEHYGIDKNGKTTHCVKLFQKDKFILNISLDNYTGKEKNIEALRQIPGEIFKDKNFEEREEREKKEERLQQLLKEGDDKH